MSTEDLVVIALAIGCLLQEVLNRRLIPKTGILCCDGDCCYPGDPGAEHVKLTDWTTNEER